MTTTVSNWDTAWTAYQEYLAARDYDNAEVALQQVEGYGIQTKPEAGSDSAMIKFRLELIANARAGLARLRTLGASGMVVGFAEGVPE